MNYLVPLVAAMRVLWLGSKVQGDFQIIRVSHSDGKTYVHLPINADTESYSKQSLFWNSRKGHAIVERSDDSDSKLRRFEVLNNLGEPLIETKGAWLSGWLGDKPEDFGYTLNDFVTLSNGTKAFLTASDKKRWVIHVHGRKANYAETLRNFKQFEELGFSQLAISHETDAKPLGLGKRRSQLGASEWRQVEVAVEYAISNGAERIVLFGWSLGGMFVNQFLERSGKTLVISGVIFDSPLLDYRGTLQLQAGREGVDRAIVDKSMEKISSSPLLRLMGFRNVDISNLSALNKSLNTQVPTLLFYSANDGYISTSGVYRYRELNPGTRLVEIRGARHCRLFNQDQEKYQAAIAEFLLSNQI
jgi:alpha-beta hydrolase superfamily lysophospholipase